MTGCYNRTSGSWNVALRDAELERLVVDVSEAEYLVMSYLDAGSSVDRVISYVYIESAYVVGGKKAIQSVRTSHISNTGNTYCASVWQR